MTETENLLTNNITPGIQVLIFSLNEKNFAIPLKDVTEVNRVTNLEVVEKAPEYVLGVINLHGKTTPMLNLKKLLDVTPSDPIKNAMWMAVKHNNLLACLMVDKLNGLLELGIDILDEIPILSGEHEVKHIKQYARMDKKLIAILDTAHILNEKRGKLSLIGISYWKNPT